eukprot:m.230148 g.230148  ORF g.230148 m.230148 type:complete len:129 (+) comp12019_c0_seq1:230-616(+)
MNFLFFATVVFASLPLLIAIRANGADMPHTPADEGAPLLSAVDARKLTAKAAQILLREELVRIASAINASAARGLCYTTVDMPSPDAIQVLRSQGFAYTPERPKFPEYVDESIVRIAASVCAISWEPC